MPETEGKYERIADRAARGQYDLVEPLDYLILAELPDEGTTFADMYPIGTTTRELVKKFPKLTNSQISSRVRALHVQNLVKKVKMLGAGDGGGRGGKGYAWQTSPAGKKLLETWRKAQNGSGS